MVVDRPRPAADELLRVEGMLLNKMLVHGYVTIEHGDAWDLLLLYGGAIHSAARLVGPQVE